MITIVGKRKAINNVGYGRILWLVNRSYCYVCLVTVWFRRVFIGVGLERIFAMFGRIGGYWLLVWRGDLR